MSFLCIIEGSVAESHNRLISSVVAIDAPLVAMRDVSSDKCTAFMRLPSDNMG